MCSRPIGSKNKPKQITQSEIVKIVEKVIESDKSELYNPHYNPKAISLQQQEDGNWYGEINKNGVVKSCRQISPEVVLQYLMYHDGEIN